MIELVSYQDENGRPPFLEWLAELRDKLAKARIAGRLRQVESGNLGDAKAVGEGVTELRIHIGAGYRIYYGRHGQHLILLLFGGDKGSQSKESAQAKGY